jgi:hypothetical protein
MLGDHLRGRQDVEAFIALRAEEAPAALEMTDQAGALYWVATAIRRMPELIAFERAR